MTVVPDAAASGHFAATGDGVDPDGPTSPRAVGDRRLTADDVLDRISQLRATDDTFHGRLIGWLADRAPEIVWAVLDDMETFAATHGGGR